MTLFTVGFAVLSLGENNLFGFFAFTIGETGREGGRAGKEFNCGISGIMNSITDAGVSIVVLSSTVLLLAMVLIGSVMAVV